MWVLCKTTGQGIFIHYHENGTLCPLGQLTGPHRQPSAPPQTARSGLGVGLHSHSNWPETGERVMCAHTYTRFLPVPIQGGADLLSLGIYVVGWHQMYPQTSPSDWGESDHLADTCNEHQDTSVFQFTVLQNYSL